MSLVHAVMCIRHRGEKVKCYGTQCLHAGSSVLNFYQSVVGDVSAGF